MADQEAPEVDPQDTPEPSETAPDTQEAVDAPEIPEGFVPEDRYKEAQAWGTRSAQEAADYRRIIDLAQAGDAEALEFLGYAPADEDTESDEFETEDDRIARLEQRIAEQDAQREEAEQQANLEEAANRFYEVEFTRLDPENEWPDDYRRLVAAVGDEYLDEDGLPQLDKAHEALQAHTEAEFKKRVAAKRSAAQAPSGASPSQTPDMDDPEQRRAELARRYAEASQPQDF